MYELPPTGYTAMCQRIKEEHAARNLTAAGFLVLMAIVDMLQVDGMELTVPAIALWARCSVRTVRRTRATAVLLGLLTVKAQFEAHDGQMWQIANAYETIVPDAPVVPKAKGGGQPGRASKQVFKKKEGLGERWRAVSPIRTPAEQIALLLPG